MELKTTVRQRNVNRYITVCISGPSGFTRTTTMVIFYVPEIKTKLWNTTMVHVVDPVDDQFLSVFGSRTIHLVIVEKTEKSYIIYRRFI
jgi:hypothetical protein